MRIAIVGAGIGGLTLAAHMKDHDIVVFERRPQPMGIGAGLLLHDQALASLRRSGVVIEGRPFTGFDVGLSNGNLLPRASRSGLAVRRPELHTSLLQAAQARIHGSTTVASYTEHPNHVEVVTHSGECFEVDVLVGADGLGSSMRHLSGATSLRRYSGATCWRGLTNRISPRDQPVELWGDGTRVGLIPLLGGTYLYLTSTEPPGSEQHVPPLERFADYAFETATLIASVDTWAHHDLDELDVHDWGHGRVPLLGDAAHGFTPNLGEGAAQAILDAEQLARCLLDNAPYPGPRRWENWKIATASRMMGRVGQAQGAAADWRDRLLGFLASSPAG